MDPTASRGDSVDAADAVLEVVRAELRAIYADLDADLDALHPRCELSGRCCRFHEFDHALFLSEAEARLLLADAPPPSRPLDDGASCPWQDPRGRCDARLGRPLGCRVYYCDPAFQDHAPGLSETYLGRIRQLTETLGLPWNYAPLHAHLRAAREEGRFEDAAVPRASLLSGDEMTHST